MQQLQRLLDGMSGNAAAQSAADPGSCKLCRDLSPRLTSKLQISLYRRCSNQQPSPPSSRRISPLSPRIFPPLSRQLPPHSNERSLRQISVEQSPPSIEHYAQALSDRYSADSDSIRMPRSDWRSSWRGYRNRPTRKRGRRAGMICRLIDDCNEVVLHILRPRSRWSSSGRAGAGRGDSEGARAR